MNAISQQFVYYGEAQPHASTHIFFLHFLSVCLSFSLLRFLCPFRISVAVVILPIVKQNSDRNAIDKTIARINCINLVLKTIWILNNGPKLIGKSMFCVCARACICRGRHHFICPIHWILYCQFSIIAKLIIFELNRSDCTTCRFTSGLIKLHHG